MRDREDAFGESERDFRGKEGGLEGDTKAGLGGFSFKTCFPLRLFCEWTMLRGFGMGPTQNLFQFLSVHVALPRKQDVV